jgi:hypothetical protein
VSDDTGSNVVHLPTRDSDSGAMPDAPDIGDLFYSEPRDHLFQQKGLHIGSAGQKSG